MKKTVISIKTFMMSCMFLCATASLGVNGVWNGTVDALWTNSANWSASPYPSGAETATFANAGNGQTLDLAGLASITSIIFDSPLVAAYTNGTGVANSQSLVLADNGMITLTDTAANSQFFNCGLQLGATLAGSTYTLNNANTSQALTFNNIFGPASGGTAGGKTLVVSGAGNTTILGSLSRGGATALTVTDTASGTLTLSGSNTVLTLNLNGGSNSVVNIGSGYLSLDNVGGTVLQSTQGGTINGNGTIRLSTAGGINYGDVKPAAGKTLVINPSIVSTGGFELNDSGTVVLNGINTFAGEVYYTANNGTLIVSKIGNRGSTDSNLGMGSKIFTLTATGCTLRYIGTGEVTDRFIELNQNFTLDHSGTGTLTFSAPMVVLANAKTLTLQGSTAGVGEISGGIGVGTGTTALTKNGTGTWILSAVNGYGGATTVNGGTLMLTGANGAITNSSGYTINAGGTLLLENTSEANNNNRLRDASAITLNGGTLSLTNNGGAVNYSESAGALTIGPGGTSTIATTEALEGQTHVLTFASLTYNAGRINFTGNGIGDSDRNSIFITTGMTDGLIGPWATINGTHYAAYSSTLGVYAFTAFTDIAAEGGVLESVIPDNGALLARINLPGVSGPITLQGEWTNHIAQVLQNTTTHTTIETLTVETHKILQTAGLSIAAGKASLTLGSSPNDGFLSPLSAGGTVVLENNNTSELLTVNAAVINNASASKLSKIGPGTVVLAGTNTYSGITTITEGVLAFASSLAQTVTAAISGGGALAKTGSGTLNINAANTYTGGTRIDAGSTVTLGNVGALGTGGVTNNGFLNITGGNNVTITGLATSLSGAGTNNVILGTGTQSTYLNGDYSAFTGVWNIGINAAAAAGRAQMTGAATGVDNSAATINVLSNATLWAYTAGTHNAALILNGGDQGEPYGQLRIDTAEWAGPITLAGPITAVSDGYIGSMNQDGIISGVIGEAGGPYEMSKVGNNKTTLTGNNTFVGPVWVKAGTVSVPAIKNVGDGAGPLGAPTTEDQARVKLGNTTVTGALAYTGSGETTTRIIDMAGTTGGATLDHSGTNLLKFTRDLLVSGVGAKQLRLQGSTVSTGEVAGVISDSSSGAVNLYKDGINNTWIVSNTNVFTGGVEIFAGTLIITNSTALGIGNKTIRISNGTAGNPQLHLDGSAGSITLGTNFTFQTSCMGGAIKNTAGTNTIDALKINLTGGGGDTVVDSVAGKLTLAGRITTDYGSLRSLRLRGNADGEVSGTIDNGNASVGLYRDGGTGTWTLSGTNTYTGATTLSGGTLLVNGSTAAGSAVIVNNGGILGGNGTINGAVTANAGATLVPGGVASVATFNLSSSLTLNGGTLVFDISNVATDKVAVAGALIVNNGIVDLALLDGSLAEGTYTLMTYASKSGSGSFVLARGYPNATLTAGATSLVLTVGAGGTGNGLTWKGNNSTNWDDVLQNWVIDSAATHFAPGDFVAFDDTAATFTVASGGAVFPGYVVFNNATDYTVSANIGGTAPFVKLGAGTTTLTGLSTYNPASVVVSGGMLTLGSASLLNGGSYAGDIFCDGIFAFGSSLAQTHSGQIYGSGALIHSGSGTLTLLSSNAFSGTVTVNAGVLRAQNAFALGTPAVGTTVNAGGTLDLAGSISFPAEAVNLYGILSSQSGSNTYAGVVSQQANSSIDVAADSILILTASTPNIGANPFSKTGVGTLRLTADPNHRGVCTVAQGTLELTGGGSTDADFIINPGATLRETTANLGDFRLTANGTFDIRVSDQIGGLDGSGTVTIGNTGSYTFSVGGGNQSGAFAGVIQDGTGKISFQKNGSGIQTLSGVNTYTGTTTVAGGTLLIHSPGSLATPSVVTANNGGILGGTGTIYGPVNMLGGSLLLPGDANVIGTLTFANDSATALTLNGSYLRCDISNQVGVCDQIAITGASGNLVLNGVNSVQLVFLEGSAPEGDYTLMTFNAYTGSGSFVLSSSYPNATLELTANSLLLHVAGGSTSAGLTWKGFFSAAWDGGIQNWTEGATLLAYAPGRAVTFDDTALQNFTVVSGAAVSPASLFFNNSANAYTVSANVSGTGALVKNGSSTATLSGVSTYNPSALTINAGTLALSGASRFNSGLYASDIFNSGTFTFDSSAIQTLSGAISGSGALIKSGSGSLTLSGASNTLGATTVKNGLLNVNTPTSLGANTLTVGNANGDRGSVVFSADATMGKLLASYSNAGAAGAVIQNSGTVLVGTNTISTDVLSLGTYAGYGYYRKNGGSLATGQLALTGNNNNSTNTAVFDLFDGPVDVVPSGGWLIFGWGSGHGVFNLFGGSLYSPPGGNDATLGYSGNNNFGMINVLGSGALLDVTGKGTIRALNLARSGGNKASVLNLNAGVCLANRIYAGSTATPTYVNFNGGTLRANVAAANFLQGLTAATIYPGGAVVDSTNGSVTVAQPLLAPTEYGVESVNLTSGGAGYIGAPVVMITGGSGTNATAIARVDLNPASGTFGRITSIEVTSRGVRYQPGDVLTVTNMGGGYTSLASATVTLGANSPTGGLTKIGSGMLTLSGKNTYGGATTISSGTLRVGIANALPTNSVVHVNEGAYDLNGFSVTNGGVHVIAGSIFNGRLNSPALIKDGEGVLNFGVQQTGPATIIINGGTLKLNGAAGLYEGRVSGAFDLALPNPQTAVRLCPTNAYMFFANSGASGGIWVDNSTYIYSGLIWNRSPTNETWTFCKSFDDSVRIIVDTTPVINVIGNWDVVTTANYVVTPGPHVFEVRVGQAAGGVGQASNKTVPGAGFDRQGRSNAAFCVPIMDPGDGSLLWLSLTNQLSAASTVALAADTMLDLGTTAQTLAGLSGSGTVSNGALTVTGAVSPAGTNVIGTLTAKANTTLSGTLVVDVATDGTGDKLVVDGDLTLLSPTLAIQNLQGLSTIKVYTLVTCSGTITGSFASTNIADTRWALRKTLDGKVQLYFNGGTILRLM